MPWPTDDYIHEKRVRHFHSANRAVRGRRGNQPKLSPSDQSAKPGPPDRSFRHFQHWTGTGHYHRRHRAFGWLDDGLARRVDVDDADRMEDRRNPHGTGLRRHGNVSLIDSWFADYAGEHATFYRHAVRFVVLSRPGAFHHQGRNEGLRDGWRPGLSALSRKRKSIWNSDAFRFADPNQHSDVDRPAP